MDDDSGSLDSEGDHDLRPDALDDLRVSGAGSRRARLFRLEYDRNDRVRLRL